jgi:hypothetical protein
MAWQGWLGEARSGVACKCSAVPGKAGSARSDGSVLFGSARFGTVRFGVAVRGWRGTVGPDMGIECPVWLGGVRYGKAGWVRQCQVQLGTGKRNGAVWPARNGGAWPSTVWPGGVRTGVAKQGWRGWALFGPSEPGMARQDTAGPGAVRLVWLGSADSGRARYVLGTAWARPARLARSAERGPVGLRWQGKAGMAQLGPAGGGMARCLAGRSWLGMAVLGLVGRDSGEAVPRSAGM